MLSQREFQVQFVGLYISTKHGITNLEITRGLMLLGVMIVFQFHWRQSEKKFWSMITIEARICCVWVTFNVGWLCSNFMIEEQHTRIFRWVPFRGTFRQKSQLKNFSLSIGEISPSFRYFAHSTKKQEYALFHTIWEMLWIPRWWTVSHCRKRSFSGNPNLTKISVRALMTSR